MTDDSDHIDGDADAQNAQPSPASEEKSAEDSTLLTSVARLTGQLAGSTVNLAKTTATLSAMMGGKLLSGLEPERLEAMADAGRFLRDARETAGISIKELSESLGLADSDVLEEVESGKRLMPMELTLRSASLLARHDPIPFIIKFLRTYNPALENRLEKWGLLDIPIHLERERRFVNLYRQLDALREMSDDEYQRFIDYTESSTKLVLDVMVKERRAASGSTSTEDEGSVQADNAAAKDEHDTD